MASLKMSVQCSHAQVWHPLLKTGELSGRQWCQKCFVFPEPKVFGESLFLPLVQVKGVFQQQNSLCELVCLQAIRLYLSEATTSGETTKKLKSGWRERIAAWPLQTQAFRFLVVCLFYFFAAWSDVGSAEARSYFLDLSGV